MKENEDLKQSLSEKKNIPSLQEIFVVEGPNSIVSSFPTNLLGNEQEGGQNEDGSKFDSNIETQTNDSSSIDLIEKSKVSDGRVVHEEEKSNIVHEEDEKDLQNQKSISSLAEDDNLNKTNYEELESSEYLIINTDIIRPNFVSIENKIIPTSSDIKVLEIYNNVLSSSDIIYPKIISNVSENKIAMSIENIKNSSEIQMAEIVYIPVGIPIISENNNLQNNSSPVKILDDLIVLPILKQNIEIPNIQSTNKTISIPVTKSTMSQYASLDLDSSTLNGFKSRGLNIVDLKQDFINEVSNDYL